MRGSSREIPARLLEALEITSETVNNAVVARAVKDVQEAVKRGETIAGPLALHEVFPPMVVQMLAVGEETGPSTPCSTRWRPSTTTRSPPRWTR